MAQEYTDAAKNRMLDQMSATSDFFISAHTGSPGLTGANEVTGGSPAYARIEGTFAAASGAEKAMTGPVTLDIPAATSVVYIGVWTAVTAGVFLGQKLIPTEVFGSQGTLDVETLVLDLLLNP